MNSGEVSEWLKEHAWSGKVHAYRGFESSLRWTLASQALMMTVPMTGAVNSARVGRQNGSDTRVSGSGHRLYCLSMWIDFGGKLRPIYPRRKWRPSYSDDVLARITSLEPYVTQNNLACHMRFCSLVAEDWQDLCARILAKALNCETTPTPCGVCTACTEIATGRSIDVFEIDGASNNSVEQIREIRESVKFVPTAGRRKVYIIDEVHMLSVSAFNALLKTLEEPPQHVLFIFATTEPHKIPDTIISRCQRFIRRIPSAQLVSALGKIATQEGIIGDILADIAREARGGMRDSLSLLDQVISFVVKAFNRKMHVKYSGLRVVFSYRRCLMP